MSTCNLNNSDTSLYELEILIRQVKREVKELSETTEASLLKHDGKLAELCCYIKDNLSKSLRDLLDSMMLSGELDDLIANTISDLDFRIDQLSNYYTPKMFDNDIQAMFNKINNEGGGVAYFPKGEYIVKDTIYIPGNTIVIGDGTSSYIYMDNKKSKIGVALLTCGSNIQVKNLKIGYASNSTIPTISSQQGCIAAGTYNYDGIIENNLEDHKDMENIIFENLYTDNRYLVQIEPNKYNKVSHVIMKNLFAKNGMVAISPTAKDNVTDVIASNIFCSFFRMGYGVFGGKNIELNNLHCNYLRVVENNVLINNLIIDATEENDFYKVNITDSALYLNGENIIVDNAIITGNKLEKYLYGINIFNSSVQLSNVKCKNFNTYNVYNAQGNKSYFTNCDFTDENETPSSITGIGSNVLVNINNVCKFYDPTLKTTGGISYGSNFSTISSSLPCELYREGTEGNLKLALAFKGSELTDNMIVANISADSFKPKKAQIINCIAFKYSTGETNTIPAIINENGEVRLLTTITGLDLTGYNRLIIDSNYSIV